MSVPTNTASHESALLRGNGSAPGWHVTHVPFAERTLVHVLERQATERPDKKWVVIDSDQSLTFSQARDQTYRFANAALATIGAKPVVALYMRNQIEFMPTFLGAQAAGGTAVPLNAELKGPLLQTMLEKSESNIIVVREDLLPHIEAMDHLAQVRLVVVASSGSIPKTLHGVPVTSFDSYIADAQPTGPEAMPNPTAVGALMFTSGTSGGSKAAVCTNHYLFWFPGCVADSLELTPDDVLSTPLQICHVAGLHNLANSSLHAGCTVHLKTYFSASSYWSDAARDGSTFSMLMGQMAAMILRSVDEVPDHRQRYTYILPQPVERREFELRYNTTVVWQGWGMTEVFPHLISRRRLEGVSDDTIGPAPTWVDFGVVDELDRILPPGTLGEMVYRPLHPYAMASGYYNDPEATQKAFRNFMFHTGDLGYYDEDGNIHFVMRNQDAIRRRGENISAVELERIALSHESVLDAAAYAVPAEFGEHEVKLDIIFSADDLDLAEFHAWLSDRLPRYMIPRYLERRSSFPKTISQRVEKYKLMKEALDRPEVIVFEPTRRAK